MWRMDRRGFVRAGLGWLAGSSALGCRPVSAPGQPPEVVVPRLMARPAPPGLDVEAGIHPLGLEEGRDGLLAVPSSYAPERGWPLFVPLHGAGGDADAWHRFFALGEELGIVMMAPESRGGTWDVVRGGFGVDVAFLDRALEHTFRRVHVDPGRICLAGFSDGASYALSVGLPNGDLFSHLAAFSPGFLLRTEERGRPEIFISHGTEDPILSFAGTQGQMVPLLQQAGYDVTFRSFAGGHEVPVAVARAALGWLAG